MDNNSVEKYSQKFAKGKPITVFIRVFMILGVITGCITLLAPFVNIMYFPPKAFTLVQAIEYKFDCFALIVSILISMIISTFLITTLNLITKKQLKKVFILNVVGVVLCVVAVALLFYGSETVLYDIELNFAIRVDKSIGFYTSYVAVFIPLIFNTLFAITSGLIVFGVPYEKVFND